MDFSLDDFFSGGSDPAIIVPYDDFDFDSMIEPHGQFGDLGAANTGHGINATTTTDLATIQDISSDATNIDWEADFRVAKEVEAAEIIIDTRQQDVGFSFSSHPGADIEVNTNELPSTHIQDLPSAMTGVDEFFIKNGACRPPAPCDHCRRRRLQCMILQTTAANPNPTSSCSSCVALFRECSLSGRAKRIPSNFETSMPVIGHLHGVKEQDSSNPQHERLDEEFLSQSVTGRSSISTLSSKRVNTRSVRKTQSLRNWYASHFDHPYPSEEEKIALSKESGLTKSQVVNWFLNARRRSRHKAHVQNQSNRIFPQGSPMPSHQLSMSPMERWRSSPPEEEPALNSAIENLISSHSSSQRSADNFAIRSFENQGFGTSGDSSSYSEFNDMSSNSASSYHSHSSAAIDPSVLSRSASSLVGESRTSSWPISSGENASKFKAFQCTFCGKSYKKKYDWVRHERSIHLPGLDSWICSVPVSPDQPHLIWLVNDSGPRCIFCGTSSPTDEHMQSHEFDACASRPISERKFTRKDHVWQHLKKFHRCRYWDGWKPNLNLLHDRQDVVQSHCGFCQTTLNSWEDRVEHLTLHFRAGLTMESWVGGSGIDDVKTDGYGRNNTVDDTPLRSS